MLVTRFFIAYTILIRKRGIFEKDTVSYPDIIIIT